jgi:C1A family cysteine protease
MKHVYKWRPDVPDARDLCLKISRFRKLPSKVDLRDKCSSVEDQGSIGSCSAQAFVAVMEYLDRKDDDQWTDLSRLFVYYNSRTDPNDDSGAYLRDGTKALAKFGACDETIWPYDIARYTVKPPDLAYKDGLKRRITEYRRTESLDGVQQSLADGFPVVFGFSVYESFETEEVAKTGIVPMPAENEQMLGGHAVVAVGYDDFTACLIVRNSWGPDWGDKGYFYMPYEYVSKELADDFWVITRVPLPKIGEEPWQPDYSDVKWYLPITTIIKAIGTIWEKIFGSKPHNRKGDVK